MARPLPANISHTVLVHSGSYKDFLSKLTTKFPELQIRYVKRVAIHYYILQLEDITIGDKGITKDEIYSLPIMALREEFSSYIFFKNVRSYDNVLKRMCNANENENAAYTLMQHMMTPFEKSIMLELEDAKTLALTFKNEKNEEEHITYCNHDAIVGAEALNKLFQIEKAVVDDEEKDFAILAKDKVWMVGIK